ncbi:MAG: hypothetical protein ACRCSL_16830 [Microbacterium sp.]
MAKTPPKEPCAGVTPGEGQSKCSGTTTVITPKSFGRETRVSRFLPHGAFTFSSPNTVTAPPRGTPCVKISVEAIRKRDTKKQKRGETYFKKVDLPYACPTGTKFLEAKGRCSDGSEPTLNRSCGSRGKPCSSVRQTCPVQFVFKNGDPYLRFCGERGKPAPLVKVENPTQAQALAQEACAEWEATTVRYGTEPGSGRVGLPGRYTADVYKAPLGGLRRRWR